MQSYATRICETLLSLLDLKFLTMTLVLSLSGCLQGKQRLLYSLLDAMQAITSQAVVIGVSCRMVCGFEVSYLCNFTKFTLQTRTSYHYYLQILVNDKF